MFTTRDDALHRARRSVLAPLFEHIVQNKVSKLCNRMQDLLASSLPVDICHTVRRISLDLITGYPPDSCRNRSDTPGYAAAALDSAKKSQPRP